MINGKKAEVVGLDNNLTKVEYPDFEQDLIKSYRKLKILIEDCKWYSVCPMKRFYEEGKL